MHFHFNWKLICSYAKMCLEKLHSRFRKTHIKDILPFFRWRRNRFLDRMLTASHKSCVTLNPRQFIVLKGNSTFAANRDCSHPRCTELTSCYVQNETIYLVMVTCHHETSGSRHSCLYQKNQSGLVTKKLVASCVHSDFSGFDKITQ